MAKKTQIKCIRSDGKEFIIGTNQDWKITEIEGIDYPSLSLYSDKNGSGDGSLFEGKRVDERDILIKAKSTNPTLNEELRQKTISFFSPKHSYKIYVTYQGVERWINGEIQGFSCPSINVYRNMELTLKFLCSDPYFKSVDNFGSDIASTSAGFAFPYIECLNPLIPVVSSIYNFTEKVVINNDGDVETYAKAVIKFSGNTKNPSLFKDEAFVKILDDFVLGDELVINFEEGTIRKNNVAIMQRIDRNSSFTDMLLGIGDSVLGFAADNGDNNMSVVIYYNKKYLGM